MKATYEGRPSDEPVELEFGEYSRLRFKIGPGPHDWIEVFPDVTRERKPCITVRGSTSMVVEPHVSNVVKVRLL